MHGNDSNCTSFSLLIVINSPFEIFHVMMILIFPFDYCDNILSKFFFDTEMFY